MDSDEKKIGEDYVECPYCNERFASICITHLKKHDKTIKDLKDEFPYIKLRSNLVNKNRIETCLEKYGVEHPMQSKEVQKKAKDTWIEKYGNKFIFQVKEVKEKIKQVCTEKYGVDNPSKSEEIKKKKKETSIKHYGVDNPNKSKIIRDKIKQTCLEKYGTDYPLLNSEVQQKSKNTLLNNYNVDHCSKSEIIKNRKRQTCLKNFGVEVPGQSIEVKEKIKETCLRKYGTDCVVKSQYFKEQTHKKLYEKFRFQLNKYLEVLDLELLDEEYKNCAYRHKWKCKKCGTIFEQLWNVIQQGEYNCPTCYPRNSYYSSSKGEIEISDFIKSLGFDIISNDRLIISPKELDIVIPEKKFAIEYNGLYWHSDEIIGDKYYHLNKLEECLKKDYTLITIFEDEWLFKKEIVQERLKYILNTSKKEKINGRDCKIKEISIEEKNIFLDKYHIQSKDASVIKLGAFYKDEMVSVMTFSHGNIAKGSRTKDKIWELNRFCTNYNYHILGIASKLLTHFERNYEWEEIFSYADRRWSSGNLYFNLKFNLDHVTTPNYWYIKGNERIHRFNLRKREDEPKDLTEVVLRLKEGYSRIWDCGNLKFIKIKEL